LSTLAIGHGGSEIWKSALIVSFYGSIVLRRTDLISGVIDNISHKPKPNLPLSLAAPCPGPARRRVTAPEVFPPSGLSALNPRSAAAIFLPHFDSHVPNALRVPRPADIGKLLATFQGHTDTVLERGLQLGRPAGAHRIGGQDCAAFAHIADGCPSADWCADFLVWLGGKRIAPDGQIETLSGDKLLKLEVQLRPHTNEDTDYARLLRWRLLTAEERSVDPYDTTTQAQAADLIIRLDMNEYETEHAYALDPWHPLVHLALAGFEQDESQADFLRRFSLDRLSNDAKLRQRAVEFLRKQGKRGFGVGSGSPGLHRTAPRLAADNQAAPGRHQNAL